MMDFPLILPAFLGADELFGNKIVGR